MALDEPKEEDYVEDFGSFKIIVEEEIIKNLPEISVDYVNNFQGKGFTVSTGAGGCGDSCGDGCG
ncbi:MAG: hypothetical protein AB2421_00450 [Thermotaleaceae bacterium]